MEINHVPFAKFSSCAALVRFQLCREATEAGKHQGCSQGCPRGAFLQLTHAGLARLSGFAVLTAPFASQRCFQEAAAAGGAVPPRGAGPAHTAPRTRNCRRKPGQFRLFPFWNRRLGPARLLLRVHHPSPQHTGRSKGAIEQNPTPQHSPGQVSHRGTISLRAGATLPASVSGALCSEGSLVTAVHKAKPPLPQAEGSSEARLHTQSLLRANIPKFLAAKIYCEEFSEMQPP